MRNSALAFAIAALSAAALQGCNRSDNAAAIAARTAPPIVQPAAVSAQSTTAAATAAQPQSTPAAAPAAWTPPTAAQLIRLLAPVAVFPDKLVAQVLAASAYPDQVSAANAWLIQNPNLKDDALQEAVSAQTWDPSVKALAQFPQVLQQMASNVPWMTALGEAYVNDPADVMNAVQALRAHAVADGKLKSNKYLTITTVPKQSDEDAAQQSQSPPPQDSGASYIDDTPPPPVYAGPPVVAPPQQVIEIAPTDPELVYVPEYDPAVYFGASILPYPGYAWTWPEPVYYGPAFGGLGFDGGIAVGFGWGYPWGWGAWALNWGPGFGFPWYSLDFSRPCVVYNNRIFVSHSTTVVNRFAGNAIRRPPPESVPARSAAAEFGGPTNARPASEAGVAHEADMARMSLPHFTTQMAAPAREAAVAENPRQNFAGAERGQIEAARSEPQARPYSESRIEQGNAEERMPSARYAREAMPNPNGNEPYRNMERVERQEPSAPQYASRQQAVEQRAPSNAARPGNAVERPAPSSAERGGEPNRH